MINRQVHRLDLGLIKEPEDLWPKLFFSWLKHVGEQNAMTRDRLSVIENAITQLDKAVAELMPEQQPAELVAAMSALKGLQETSKQQTSRGLDSVEKLALIAQQIVADQNTE